MTSDHTVRVPYADREEAGRLLAEWVVDHLPRDGPAVVLALPRGGVPVGVQVARVLAAPLDVYVTRKVGAPDQPELGVGAIAEDGQPVYDNHLLARLRLHQGDLASTVQREWMELDRRVRAYRGERPLIDVRDTTVVLVDDGLATGGTARAALRGLRTRQPAALVLAAPVGAADTVRDLGAEADLCVVPAIPQDFHAVGQWYRRFEQLTDDDVVRML